MDDFDEDAAAHLERRALLEDDDDETLGSRRRRARDLQNDPDHLAHREATADAELFGKDDLEKADEQIGSLSPSAQVDGLHRKVALRDQHQDDLVQQAKFVRLQPPSVLKGTLGGQQNVLPITQQPPNPNPNGLVVSPAQVANWGGTEDAETTIVTVTFSPVVAPQTRLPGEGYNGSVFRPYGIVQWGTRGAMVNLEVDIGTGRQFCIGASQVNLLVALDTDPSQLPNSVGSFGLRLSGMLSFLPVQKNQQLTRTKYVDVPTAMTGDTIIVPPFATSVALWRSDVTDSNVLTFRNAAGNGVYVWTQAAGQANDMLTPIPLTGEVFSIGVVNTGGHAYSLIFFLGV
jgi:hypothetical protein